MQIYQCQPIYKYGGPLWRGCFLLFCWAFLGCQSPPKQILLHTDQGDIQIQLSWQTPRYTANFEKLAREKFYDRLLIHRVAQEVLIQTGDPDSRVATPGMHLGNGDPGYSLPAETGTLPLRGALAVPRPAGSNAADQRSHGSQFFIVQGRAQTDASLDAWEEKLHYQFSPDERRLYLLKGGAPQLQGHCTVFGAVISGMEVVDKIAALPRDAHERPLQDVRIWMEIQ